MSRFSLRPRNKKFIYRENEARESAVVATTSHTERKGPHFEARPVVICVLVKDQDQRSDTIKSVYFPVSLLQP